MAASAEVLAEPKHQNEHQKSGWIAKEQQNGNMLLRTEPYARLTNWSITRFSPALSKSTVSLLPSTDETRP